MAAISTSVRPSFFKPLILHFSTRLRLPDVFVRKYKESMPQNMKLRIATGKTWDVKVEEIDGGGEWFFTAGWKEFVEDLELKEMQMLVFWLNIGKATFDVAMYATNACEREISDLIRNHRLIINGGEGGIKRKNESKSESEREKKRGRGSSSNPLYFEKTLKLHQRSRISLPNEFSRASNVKEKTHVRLVFLPTNCCETVVVDPRPENHRFDLSKGWFAFRVANGLEYEKIYSFEFKPNEDAIHVKEVKKGSSRKWR